MEATSAPEALEQGTPGWHFAVSAGILGWVLDAFDFFVVIFLLDTLAGHLHVTKAAIVLTITATLAMRPLGALLFGTFADRYGRKKPLMVCVIYFSTVTVLSGFAPTYGAFLTLRALYGIGMGGYWGIGASFAMENAPRKRRGLLSGLMQAGYPFGYLLAAVAMQTLRPRLGWQPMFVVGSALALVIVVLTAFSQESESWKQHRMGSVRGIFRTLWQHKRGFAYLLLVMTGMSCLSHGTQDLYPDFLKSVHAIRGATVLGMQPLFGIPILFNICAIIGALLFGHLSEGYGRRMAIIGALILALLAIPVWAFGSTVAVLAVGSCLMQAGVQGAFGVIPAHLNELSPDAVRSLFPGFVYQLGVLVASPAVLFEYVLRNRLGYPWALTTFELVVIVSLMFIFGLGPEQHGRSFLAGERAE